MNPVVKAVVNSAGSTRRQVWLTVGRTTTLLTLLLCLLMQLLNHDFFPPEVSVSQYGVGPYGWVFTCWAAAIATAVPALTAGGPAASRPRYRAILSVMLAGSAGLLLMGVIRTDAGGAQHSWHAKTHLVGSVIGLVAMPIGTTLALKWAQVWWRRAAWALTVVIYVALILVLVSAFGGATLGMDASHSWAWWQAVAVVSDMVLLTLYAFAGARTAR